MLLKTIKCNKRRFLSLLIATVLVFTSLSLSSFALSDSEKQAYKDKISDIKEQIEENKKKIAELDEKAASYDDEISAYQDKIDTLQDQIDLYNDEIGLIQSDIDVVDGQITSVENEIEALNKEIEELDQQVIDIQQQIADTYTLLGKRIRATYMSGANSALEYLLTSENFNYQSYLERVELLNRIAEHDDALIQKLEKDIEDLQVKVQEIEDMKTQKNTKIQELEEMKKDLEAKKKEQVDARKVIQSSEDEIQSQLDKVMSIINSYNAESKEYQAAIAKGESAISDYEDMLARQEQSSGNTGSGFTGDMIWPLPYSDTYISSSYKMRTLNGVTRQHNGIDICRWGGTYGATVQAVKAGTVTTANKSGYGGGYGLYVVIDHGNGVKTYYAHLSSVSVSVGNYVSQGTVIGCAGNTGYSFGAHLHFGLMINGNWVNPTNYLTVPSGVSRQG